MPSSYRFPSIRPVVPPIQIWTPFLEEAYAAKWFSNFGPVVTRFEAGLTKRLCHHNEAITTASNCTAGIAAALIALRIRGTVLVPAYSFPATVSAVIMAGAQPCMVDVDQRTWSLSPDILDKALRTHRHDGVIFVAPFGLRENLSSHFEICERHGVPLIIDNASGLDSLEEPLPNERFFEIYSLHATKAFPIGEGGAIRSFASQSNALRCALNFGLESGKPRPGCWGINGKLPEVSAAIGLAVLEQYDRVIAHRRMIAGRYIELLAGFDRLFYPTQLERAPWQLFPVLFPSRVAAEAFIEKCASRSLQVRTGYRPSLENWPGTQKVGPCPNAGSLADRMVLLPVYSDGTEEEITEIIEIARLGLTEDRWS
jgi:dTDP-4-amino-4,6-dideoxygalactose transaminase